MCEPGEVLALANVPSYNPNNVPASAERSCAPVITDLFEPGSTLKPFTLALAIERGKVTPATLVQTAPGHLTIADYTIHDTHPGARSARRRCCKNLRTSAWRKSPCRCRAKRCGPLQARRLRHRAELGFPGEAAGKLRHYRSWRPIEQATLAYGMGISVSLVQLARAYTVFARDGELLR